MRAVMFGLLMVFGMCMVVEGTRPEKCELPEESGLCRAMFPKFFFNRLTNQCEEFIYGGCGGNENRFDTEEECLAICGQGKKIFHEDQ